MNGKKATSTKVEVAFLCIILILNGFFDIIRM